MPEIFSKKIGETKYRRYAFDYALLKGKERLIQKYWWIIKIDIDRVGSVSIIDKINYATGLGDMKQLVENEYKGYQKILEGWEIF